LINVVFVVTGEVSGYTHIIIPWDLLHCKMEEDQQVCISVFRVPSHRVRKTGLTSYISNLYSYAQQWFSELL